MKENPQFYLHAKVLSDFITDNDELTPMEGEIVNVVNLGKEVTYDVKFTNGETVRRHPIDLRPIGNDSTLGLRLASRRPTTIQYKYNIMYIYKKLKIDKIVNTKR